MIQSIPLKKLVPSPRNVRKVSDATADAQLKTDIAARGLLQNLVVRKATRGKFEVEAGGRRLAALHSLAEDAAIPTSPSRDRVQRNCARPINIPTPAAPNP